MVAWQQILADSCAQEEYDALLEALVRRAHKVDANQSKIIQGLRDLGCSVQPLSAVGAGCPDLLVGMHGRNFLLEVKDGDRPPSERRLTKDQEDWHDEWRGQKAVVSTLDEAIEIIRYRFGVSHGRP